MSAPTSKLSKEQIKQQQDELAAAKAAELAALDPNAEPVLDPNAEPTEPVVAESETVVTPDPVVPVITPDPNAAVTPAPTTLVTPTVDYREKFAQSTANAQLLEARLKAYKEANSLPLPTDDECRARFGDSFDEESEITKQNARMNLRNEKRDTRIAEIDAEAQASNERVTKINAFAVDPSTVKSFPLIEGREEEFAEFARKPSRTGLDIEDIAISFTAMQTARGVTKKVAHRGAMMQPGTPSAAAPAKQPKTTITAQQAQIARNVDHKQYEKDVRSGKIRPQDLLM